MKQIALDSQQKVKLVEMAKALFPRYIDITITDGTCDFCIENTILFKLSKKHNDWLQLHWFEFCITHLLSDLELLNPITDIEKLGNWEKAMKSYNIHIVDHLYEEFKKLTPH